MYISSAATAKSASGRTSALSYLLLANLLLGAVAAPVPAGSSDGLALRNVELSAVARDLSFTPVARQESVEAPELDENDDEDDDNADEDEEDSDLGRRDVEDAEDAEEVEDEAEDFFEEDPALSRRASKTTKTTTTDKKTPTTPSTTKTTGKATTTKDGKDGKTTDAHDSKQGGSSDPSKGPVPSLAEILKHCTVPKDKALFWSGTAEQVKPYRAAKGLTTDSQAFPSGYTKTFRGKDQAKDVLFSQRFSQAFATKASGTVYLMVPWKTGPRPDRVFHKDEWPIVKKSLASGKITKVIQVNPDNTAETRTYDPKLYGLTRRADQLQQLARDLDLDNVPWNVDLDVLEEAWNQSEQQQQE